RTVVVASGLDFPDALSAQLPASITDADLGEDRDAGQPVPILLTRPGSLPAATRAALRDLAPDKISIVGGTGAVEASVEQELRRSFALTERISGIDRYATSAEIAKAYPVGVSTVYVVSGTTFADALSAGARAGADGVPILLTEPGRLR